MSVRKICGCILALFVAFARLAGGAYSLFTSTSVSETEVGIGLLVVSSLILLSIIMYWLKRTALWHKMINVSMILFWLDGILNGFLLFGTPQISGQIINLCCTLAVIFLLGRISDSKAR